MKNNIVLNVIVDSLFVLSGTVGPVVFINAALYDVVTFASPYRMVANLFSPVVLSDASAGEYILVYAIALSMAAVAAIGLALLQTDIERYRTKRNEII